MRGLGTRNSAPGWVTNWKRVSRQPSGRSPFGHQRVYAEVRRVLVKRFPYGVYYLVEGEVLLVLAVAHSRRKPHYWADRMRTTDVPKGEESP